MTIGCLVLHQRYKRRVENYLSLTKELSTASVDTKDTVINDADRNRLIDTDSEDNRTARNRLRSTVTSQDSNVTFPDIEDIGKSDENDKNIRPNELCSGSYACSGTSRQHCQDLVHEYHQQQHLEFQEFYNTIQSLRHTVLLILLLCSMFVVCKLIV